MAWATRVFRRAGAGFLRMGLPGPTSRPRGPVIPLSQSNGCNERPTAQVLKYWLLAPYAMPMATFAPSTWCSPAAPRTWLAASANRSSPEAPMGLLESTPPEALIGSEPPSSVVPSSTSFQPSPSSARPKASSQMGSSQEKGTYSSAVSICRRGSVMPA